MCGRITGSSSRKGERDDDLDERVGALTTPISDLFGRYNIGPMQAVPIVRQVKDGREAVAARWSLLFTWAKTPKLKFPTFNARAENLTTSKLWKPLIGKSEHRVLVLADGWYEWLHSETKKEKPAPFLHLVDSGGWFCFAGLATTVRLPDEAEPLTTATIITTTANQTASKLHDRMPAVLSGPDAEALWLSPEVGTDDALSLLGPLEDDRLTIRPASKLVNKIGNEGPELLDPAAS